MDHHSQHVRRTSHSRIHMPRFDIRDIVPSRTTVERSIVELTARAPKCTDDDAPECRKPTQVPTLPIVLGVLIPLVGAAVILIYLHRRHIKKLREEDAKDKYKSLDFGVEPMAGGSKRGKGPEMSIQVTEKSGRHDRGISLDIQSPYMMPPGLNGSRESFHSLSRSMNDPQDPYRPVTFIKGDDSSVRSGSRSARNGYDNGSMYTTSSGATDKDRMNNGLLKNAQRMSRSVPPRSESMSPEAPEIRFPEPVAQARSPSPLNPQAAVSQTPASPRPAARSNAASPPPQNGFQSMSPPVTNAIPEIAVQDSKAMRTAPSPPPRIQSQTAVVHENANTASMISTSSYGEGFKVTPPSPTINKTGTITEEVMAPEPLRPQANAPVGLGVDAPDLSMNRLSMSLRPLPPDDPNDNPEQRANRIRSFYKEYFDESKPEPAGGHAYHEPRDDYTSEYMDGAVFDPATGSFIVAQPQMPFAQPVTRRAMTPPPRAPPRFRSGSNPRGPHMSNGSMASQGRFPPPRNMSSMSGRLPAPRAPLPPPQPLSSLPTPAKLTEDSMVFNPLDFAPPVSYRERQNGVRPDSPLGTPRPYSPAVRPHTPLVSSFDDLAVMPSPHMLRKSGTFTALDFAPPPRFRDPENASDAGSIRSNRSGMSAAGRMAVRAGANRVSRIPKEVVGTRDDIVNSLRPKMNMVAPA